MLLGAQLGGAEAEDAALWRVAEAASRDAARRVIGLPSSHADDPLPSSRRVLARPAWSTFRPATSSTENLAVLFTFRGPLPLLAIACAEREVESPAGDAPGG